MFCLLPSIQWMVMASCAADTQSQGRSSNKLGSVSWVTETPPSLVWPFLGKDTIDYAGDGVAITHHLPKESTQTGVNTLVVAGILFWNWHFKPIPQMTGEDCIKVVCEE